MALEVGIVGPPGSGKTSLFTALTQAAGGEYGKTNVGIAPIADERLAALAGVVHARKVTPATIRVQDVPGAGEAQLGNLRQVDALLVVLRGFGPDPDPEGDLETFGLELLVADRDHVERRLERVTKQAKSGDAKLRAEVEELGARARPRRRRRLARRLPGRAAAGARAAHDEAAARGRQRAGRHRLKLEAELAELPDEEAAAFRDGATSALDEVVAPVARCARPDHVLHGRREGDAGLDAPNGEPHSTPRRRSTPTSRAASSAARWSTGRISSSAGRTPRSRSAGKQRLEGKTYVVRDGDVLNIRFNV